MSWILFSVLAALIWSIANIIDKFIITKWLKEPAIPVMFLGIIGLVIAGIIFLVKGFQLLSPFNIFLALIAGCCYILTNAYYLKALKREEVSRAVPLYYTTPLFVLFLASIFLGESFQPLTYLGIILLVSGAVMISIKKTHEITVSKALGLMLLAALLWAIYSVIIKYLLNFADFWTIFAYARVGAMIASIPLIYVYFPKFLATVREHGNKVTIAIILNETLNITGVFIYVIALSIGFASLVETLTSVHPFFILIFTILLSIFLPHILKEKIDRKKVLLKFVAIALMFFGIILIT